MQEKVEKDYSLEVVKKCWNLCPYILLNYLLFSSWCALQTVRHFLKLLPVSIVSEALFIYDMTSALADSKNFGGNLSAKTQQFLFVKKKSYLNENSVCVYLSTYDAIFVQVDKIVYELNVIPSSLCNLV